MLRVLLVRHGQTDANLNRVLQGQSDGVLNKTGRAQAQALARHLKDFPIDHVISSTLRRARATAAGVARSHGLTVNATPLIVEWNCGDLDGMPAEVFRRHLAGSALPISALHPNGGESMQDVQARARLFLAELTARHDGQTVLVCSHGDFMRALMSLILAITLDQASTIHFDNASFTILEFENGAWRLVALNQLPPQPTSLVGVALS